MKRIFQWVRSLVQRRSPLPAVPRATRWTSADRDQWKHFLASSTGLRLTDRLRAVEAANAIAGAADILHTVHSAGRSNGYSDLLNHILSLAHVCDPEPVKIEVEEGLTEDEQNWQAMTENFFGERVT